MDDIERAIHDAWQRIGPRILADRKELKRRLRRREGRFLSRPPRAWCLAVRASDRRLVEYGIGPRDRDLISDVCPLTSGPLSGQVRDQKSEISSQIGPAGHDVWIDSHLLRGLCGVVKIPGCRDVWDRVAKVTGRGFRGLHTARVSGRLRAVHVPLLGGRWGNPVPILQCREELDPNWRGLEGADRVWGWTARFLVNRVPEDFEATLERVPVWRGHVRRGRYEQDVHPEVSGAPPKRSNDRLPPPGRDGVWYKWSTTDEYLGDDPGNWRKSPNDPGLVGGAIIKNKRRRKPKPSVSGGSLHFRGWMWVCPKCGKEVRTVYLPVRGVNLIESDPLGAEIRNPKLEIRNKFKIQGEMSKTGRLEHSDFGHLDLFRPRVTRSDFDIRISETGFACYRCHRIRGFTRVGKNSWNELVGYLSGGLLYGREVPVPGWFRDEGLRRVEYKPRLGRPAPRREAVLRRMLNGWTITQIARNLKMCKQQVCASIRALCRQEGVKDRRELARKLGSGHFQPMDRDRKSLEPQMNTNERR